MHQLIALQHLFSLPFLLNRTVVKRTENQTRARDPTTFSITVFNAPTDEAVLASYRKAGIHRVLLEAPDLGRDDVLRVLDRNAPLAHGFT